MIKSFYSKNIQCVQFLFFFTLTLVSQGAIADVYKVDTSFKCENNNNWVKTDSACIRYSLFNEKTDPKLLAIFLHGDFWAGGVDYMSSIAKYHSTKDVMTAAIVRPGYYDSQGNFSDGKMLGAYDHYTLDNTKILSNAIYQLKNIYHPNKVVLVGHSGGAAMASLIANLSPDIADGLFLFACPCDTKQWRPDWKNSLNPIEKLNNLKPNIKINAYVGSWDENTYPELSKAYVEKCKKIGLNANLFILSDMGHNFRSIDRDQEFHLELKKYLLAFINERT